MTVKFIVQKQGKLEMKEGKICEIKVRNIFILRKAPCEIFLSNSCLFPKVIFLHLLIYILESLVVDSQSSLIFLIIASMIV